MKEEAEGQKLQEAMRNLASPSIKQRLAAVDQIGLIGGEQAIRILVELLKNESWHLRVQAAKALGHSGKEAIPILLTVLEEGVWYVKASALHALGEIGELASVDSILEMLDNSNSSVRSEARTALSKIVMRDPSAFTSLYIQNADSRKVMLDRLKGIDREAYQAVMKTLQEMEGDGGMVGKK